MPVDHTFFLQLLDQVKPNCVYTLADPRQVINAIGVAEREMITAFTWKEQGLEATFVNNEKALIVPQPGGRVVLQSPPNYPLYALAALISYFVIRKGSRLLRQPLGSDYRDYLEKMIRTNQAPKPGETSSSAEDEEATPEGEPKRFLALQKNFDWEVVLIDDDNANQTRAGYFLREMRTRNVVANLNSGEDIFANIREYLNRSPSLPVCLPTPEGLKTLRAGPTEPVIAGLTISHQGSQVHVSLELPRHQQDPINTFFNSTWGMTDGGLLVNVDLPPLALHCLQSGATPLPEEKKPTEIARVAIDVSAFNQGLTKPEANCPPYSLRSVRWLKGEQDFPLRQESGSVILAINSTPEDDEESFEIIPALQTPGGIFPLSGMRDILVNWYSARGFVQLLNQPERRDKLFTALAEVPTLKNRSQLKKWLQKWDQEDWGGVRLNDDGHLFLQFCGTFLYQFSLTHHWPIAHPSPGPDDTPFTLVDFEVNRYLLAELAIAFAISGKDLISHLETVGETLEVPLGELPTILDQIQPLAELAGFPVLFDGQPINFRDIDLVLSLERDEERIDWFQVNPEFFAEGHLLKKKDWQDVLKNQSLLKKTDQGIEIFRLGKKPGNALGMAYLKEQEESRQEGVSRLQIFDLLDLRRRGATINLPPADADVLESLARFKSVPETPLPPGLNATLRPYQKSGYDWLVFLYRHRFGACLADDMGLGKTLQTIAFLLALKEGTIPAQPGAKGPFLLILPASLIFNWQAECARFAPSLRVQDYRGSDRQLDLANCDCLLTTYDVARRDIEILLKERFHVLIYDEAQALKNAASKRHRELRKVPATFRICLTGTPVENHVGEYQAILNLALPGLFTDLQKSSGSRKSKIPPERILRRSAPFVLRRTKGSVLRDLPPKEEREVVLEMIPRQKALYLRETARVREDIAAAFKQKSQAQAGIIALAAINRLRQLCVHPRLLLPRESSESPKFTFVLEQLEALREEGHAALIFSQYVTVLDLLGEQLKKDHIEYFRLDGSTSGKKRQQFVESFQKGEGPGLFLISLKAGGVGLNLTRASYVFHLDPWWNPAVENQASDRAHRIGQKQRVLIQKLIMKDSVEEKISLLKKDKAKLFAQLLGPDDQPTLSGALSREDFAFLLS